MSELTEIVSGWDTSSKPTWSIAEFYKRIENGEELAVILGKVFLKNIYIRLFSK